MADASENDLGKLKVADLKKLLKEKHLAVTGNKAELIQRLQEAGMGQEMEPEDDDLNDISDDVLNDDLDEAELKEKESVGRTKQEDLLAEDPAEPKPKTNQPAASTTDATEGQKVKLGTLVKTPEEQLAERSRRFGAVTEDSKKKLRAERFGLKASNGTSLASKAGDVDKMKKRAERFGTVISPALSKEDLKLKLQQRAERFGATSSTAAKGTETDKLLKRKARFGSTDPADDMEAKRKARAERFGLAK